MRTKTFNVALNSLVDPVSIAAIMLLLINDHWIRQVSPSWWTGKLGDFAWIVFAPFICASILTWIVPNAVPHHTRQVGQLACLVMGIWFTLAKTSPLFHMLTVAIWEAIIGWHGTQRLDPSDLIVLPGLLVSWRIWKQSMGKSKPMPSYKWMVLTLGTVATLASDEPTHLILDKGVDIICETAGKLRFYEETYNGVKEYLSRDGGLNWELGHFYNDATASGFNGQLGCSMPSSYLIDLIQPDIQYRWKPAESIERSTDGGKSWKIDFDLFVLRQDVREHFKPVPRNIYGDIFDASPGPRSGVFDSSSGNVVLSMGWDGALVRTNDGVWHWVRIGPYQLRDLSSPMRNTLLFELPLSIALIGLPLVTAAAYIRRARTFRRLIIALGWIGWMLLAVVLAPLNHATAADPLNEHFILMGLVSLALMIAGLILLIGALFDLIKHFGHLVLAILITGLISAVLYLFPLILWSRGTIPRYVTAMIFSVLLAGTSLMAGYRSLRPRLPIMPGLQPQRYVADAQIGNKTEHQ